MQSAFDHHIFSHHGQSQKNFYHPCIRGMWSDSRLRKETKRRVMREEEELSQKPDPLAALEDPITFNSIYQHSYPFGIQ